MLFSISLFVSANALLPYLNYDQLRTAEKDKDNEHIAALQNALNNLGYIVTPDENGDPTPPSGIYDFDTKDAIMDFQKENDLKVTGEINLETIQTLNSMIDFVNKDPDYPEYDNQELTIWEKIGAWFRYIFNQ